MRHEFCILTTIKRVLLFRRLSDNGCSPPPPVLCSRLVRALTVGFEASPAWALTKFDRWCASMQCELAWPDAEREALATALNGLRVSLSDLPPGSRYSRKAHGTPMSPSANNGGMASPTGSYASSASSASCESADDMTTATSSAATAVQYVPLDGFCSLAMAHWAREHMRVQETLTQRRKDMQVVLETALDHQLRHTMRRGLVDPARTHRYLQPNMLRQDLDRLRGRVGGLPDVYPLLPDSVPVENHGVLVSIKDNAYAKALAAAISEVGELLAAARTDAARHALQVAVQSREQATNSAKQLQQTAKDEKEVCGL